MRGVYEDVILLARKIDIELVSFRGRGGSVFRPQLESFPRCIFQMSRQRGARNAEQFCCAALVAIGLIVNEADQAMQPTAPAVRVPHNFQSASLNGIVRSTLPVESKDTDLA
jgi:hypothetical protein